MADYSMHSDRESKREDHSHCVSTGLCLNRDDYSHCPLNPKNQRHHD